MRGRHRRGIQEAIAEALRTEILRQPPGARLASVDVLAARFGASPKTVVAALQALAREGLVVIRPRVGVFVAGQAANSGISSSSTSSS
ncbi:MAG: winged helix-turn-helix domain-containing protein [Armatimonadota bacterium]|nr:winged helix-turn-helix domain-containing protein [Armatimonadota bacterium]MDR7444153.1 winged helix-turn-helix domain-containing protein [Armatimonadota bacterium]MDR7571032.1 winged helix-turn-helix domain-containing protein [Armatimonadota bacterium]MDR7613602.1 winged helix-turn-helix domain-containing protein [Armatimonadota bacterium]